MGSSGLLPGFVGSRPETVVPLVDALRLSPIASVVTDATLPDNPIVFANDAFLAMTGYAAPDVLGRNWRFLDGPRTDPATADAFVRAVAARESVSFDILNYRRGGESFWNRLSISPMLDGQGRLLGYLGLAAEAPSRRAGGAPTVGASSPDRMVELENVIKLQQILVREIDHRVKNNLQMVSAMLMLQAMSIPDAAVKQTLQEMLERVEALALVHKRLFELSQPTRFDLADYVRELVESLVATAGRKDIVLDLRLEPIVIGADLAASVALILNEALTNAFKHAFRLGRGHRLGVTLRRDGDQCRIDVRDDGPGIPTELPRGSTFGATLIETLGKELGATLAWRRLAPGTQFDLAFPIEPADLDV